MKATQLRFGFARSERRRPDPRKEAERMLGEALAGPDPADERLPQVGDVVEVLWRAPHWYRGEVIDIWRGMMDVRITEIGRHVIWSTYVTRRDRARNLNVDKGPIWRWPREGETA